MMQRKQTRMPPPGEASPVEASPGEAVTPIPPEPPPEPAVQPQPVVDFTPPPRSSRRRWIAAAVFVLLGVALAVWWYSRPARLTPPMPQGIQEAEIREAIGAARERVLANPDSSGEWGHYAKMLLAHLF